MTIGHWFDPALSDLPALPDSSGLSTWFYPLVEPIWECAEHALLPNPDRWVAVNGGKVCVGMEPDIGVWLSKSMTYFESPTVYGDDETGATSIAVEVSKPTARSGFEFQTELGLLVSLDGNVPAQMKIAERLLQSAQIELQSAANAASDYADYEPIIHDGMHPRTSKFLKLNSDLVDLTSSAPAGRRQWRLALFDVRFDITAQIKSATTLLMSRQATLSEEGKLSTPARQRAGSKDEGQFWLKAALCCLEAQLVLMAKYTDESFGRKNLSEAILSPSHAHHLEVRGANPASHEPTEPERQAETIRKAADVGRALALGQYIYLIGATAADLQPAKPRSGAAIKGRRFVQGKLVPSASPKRGTVGRKKSR